MVELRSHGASNGIAGVGQGRREAVRQSILSMAARLDLEEFEAWMTFLAQTCTYRIVCYSEELRKTQTLFEADYDELGALFRGLEHHVRDRARLTRMVSTVDMSEERTGMLAMSNLLVLRTGMDGRSSVFAVGRYRDRWTCDDDGNGEARLEERRVELVTRDLGSGSHVPL